MEQDIRFCKTSDGVRIAYAVTGGGPPLVRSLGWFTHLEHEWETPYFGPFNQILSQHYTLVRYDGRGMGLSDRNTADFSLEAKVKDLEAVIDGAGIDRCAIMGLSEGGPTAVAYAVKHPDRVSRLVLYGSNPSFNQMAETSEGRQLADAMINLARVGWGSDHPSYRQFFTAMFMPDAPAEALRTFSQYQRASAPPESVVAISLSRKVGTPEASAASSSSRMVAKPKPRRERSMVRAVMMASTTALIASDQCTPTRLPPMPTVTPENARIPLKLVP